MGNDIVKKARQSKAAGFAAAVELARANPHVTIVDKLQRKPPAAPAPVPTQSQPPTRSLYRSKLEEQYARILDDRVAAGTIAGWRYEPISLVIVEGNAADRSRCRYRCDFVVWHHMGPLELVEVKGARCQEAARIRFKLAVQQWGCFRWTWARKTAGQWTETAHKGGT